MKLDTEDFDASELDIEHQMRFPEPEPSPHGQAATAILQAARTLTAAWNPALNTFSNKRPSLQEQREAWTAFEQAVVAAVGHQQKDVIPSPMEDLVTMSSKWAREAKVDAGVQALLKHHDCRARLVAYVTGSYGEGLNAGRTEQENRRQLLIDQVVEIAADNGYHPGDRLQRILVRVGHYRRTGELSPHAHIPRGPHASC